MFEISTVKGTRCQQGNRRLADTARCDGAQIAQQLLGVVIDRCDGVPVE